MCARQSSVDYGAPRSSGARVRSSPNLLHATTLMSLRPSDPPSSPFSRPHSAHTLRSTLTTQHSLARIALHCQSKSQLYEAVAGLTASGAERTMRRSERGRQAGKGRAFVSRHGRSSPSTRTVIYNSKRPAIGPCQPARGVANDTYVLLTIFRFGFTSGLLVPFIL